MDTQYSAAPLQPYLLEGEKILWVGKPAQGLMVSAMDSLLIPFSLLWGGFAIFWNVSVWTAVIPSEGIDWSFRLWGLPFLCIGIYIMFGRFFHDAALRKNQTYAVTGKRVIVLKSAVTPRVSALDIERLPRLELNERRDGSGTIEFEGDSWSAFGGANGFGIWVPALSRSLRFFRIEDARQVYDLINAEAYRQA